MVQTNKLLALELLEQGLSDRQGDAKAGCQLGGAKRFAGQRGEQLVAALGQPAVIQQPLTEGGDLLGLLVKAAGQHIAVEPQLQGGRVVVLQLIWQLAQQGVQRLASGGMDVAAPDDAGSVQQIAAAVANDGERLAEEAGDGAGKDQPCQPSILDGHETGPAMPAAKGHLDLLRAQCLATQALGVESHDKVGCRLALASGAGKAMAAGHLLVGHFFKAHRHPTDGAYLVDALVIGLQGAHLHLPVGGVEAQLVPHLEAALLQCAGKHGAGAIGGKDPVYIQSRGGLFAGA